jgi:hypothetical protein
MDIGFASILMYVIFMNKVRIYSRLSRIAVTCCMNLAVSLGTETTKLTAALFKCHLEQEYSQ